MAERPGDWQCPNTSCVNHTRKVFGSKANCPKCGTSRDEVLPEEVLPEEEEQIEYTGACPVSITSKAERGMQGGDMPDDWQCPNPSCLNHTKMVFAKRSSCPSCGTARNAKQPGDWQCPNQQCVNNRNTVFASKTACPKCGSPRPGSFGPIVQATAVRNTGPYPTSTGPAFRPPIAGGFANVRPAIANGGFAGGGFANGFAGNAVHASAGPGDWQCPNVSCMNNTRMVFGKNQTCPKCGSPKEAPRVHRNQNQNPNDWQCPNTECLNHRNKVFAKHASCPSCGSDKPE